MTIESVAPTSSEYETLEEFVNSANQRFDYQEFADNYNKAALNFILVFEYGGSMMSNFVKVLASRGLERDVDYEFRSTRAKTDNGTHRVVLKKLTTNNCIAK